MRAAVHMLRQQQRVLVWGFWALALCVAVLSLMPTNYLPAQVFSLWDKAQHALAFTALASLGLLAYPRQPWRVAIAPVPAAVGPAPDAPPQAIALRDCAIATSGSLYHCHQWQGRSYSHTLDPRTGAPIAHALASVTVLHAECLHADALATLLTVLGPEAGWEFAEQHGIAALLSSPTATRCSRAWEAALGTTPFAPALEPHV